MGLFSKYNSIEANLLETYSKIFTDMGLPNARNEVKGFLDKAILDSKKAGRYGLKNMGDVLLKQEESSGQKNLSFEKKRKEGVRDGDIKWWFNLDDIERMMMLKVDEIARLSLFASLIEKGEDVKRAVDIVAKFHPNFGNPDDTANSSGDDRPIPYELKDRINIYIQKRANKNSEQYKNELEESSSFNALIRKEIKAGNL